MARGSIRKRQLEDGSVRYDAVVDMGADTSTGKRRQRKKTYSTKKEAQAGLVAWLAEIDKGTAVDRSAHTLGDVVEFWLDTHARHRVSARTLDGYARTIQQHILPTLGGVEIQKLTPARLQAFYSERIDAGCGPRTVELCHLHISQALDQAVKLGWISRNVADAATPPRWKPREMQTWDAEEARRFVAVAHQSIYGPIWLLALATGMRKGELLGLRWRDVDTGRGVASIRQTIGTLRGKVDIKPPKTASSRRDVHMPRGVLAALREHRRTQDERRRELGPLWDDYDLVFTAANGGPIHPDNLDRDYARLVRRAGVRRIRIHDLRHSFATLAIALGVPIKVVSESMGHADIATTLRTYTHVLPAQRTDLADKVGSALFGGPADTDAPAPVELAHREPTDNGDGMGSDQLKPECDAPNPTVTSS